MPRKPKEVIEKEQIIENVEKKKTGKSTSSTKKVASSTTKTKKESVGTKSASVKKENKAKVTIKEATAKTRKAESKSDIAEKKDKTATKSSTKKTSTSTTVKEAKPKKASTKTATKNSAKKASTSTTAKETKTKKASAKTATKSSTKKTSTSTTAKETKTKKASTKSTVKKGITRTKKAVAIPEYYDLPYHYNQTVVKVLAQTPKTLFVYWDVSNEDKENLEKQFGPNFFNNTVPFLRVKNETNNYCFDVDVDDFANGWYLEVEDSKCNYSIELLRKQRPYTEKVIDKPIYITSSNKMETPNDRILFDTNLGSVNFKNVKTNEITTKKITSASSNMEKIYNIYDLYKKIYKNEDIGDIFDLTNPSSGNPTSTFK